jgi:hypothetical protein
MMSWGRVRSDWGLNELFGGCLSVSFGGAFIHHGEIDIQPSKRERSRGSFVWVDLLEGDTWSVNGGSDDDLVECICGRDLIIV